MAYTPIYHIDDVACQLAVDSGIYASCNKFHKTA